MSKEDIVTGDFALPVTRDRMSFLDIANTLTYRERKMLVIIEGRPPVYGVPQYETSVTTATWNTNGSSEKEDYWQDARGLLVGLLAGRLGD